MAAFEFEEKSIYLRNLGDNFFSRYESRLQVVAKMPEVANIFLTNAMLPFARRTCAYLESGRWKGYERPQQAIADKVGMERSCFSRAKTDGTLPTYVLVALMFDPHRPKDWLDSCANLSEMNRAGLLAVIRHLAAIVKPDRPDLILEQMDEFHYESTTAMIRQFTMWFDGRLHNDINAAKTILRSLSTRNTIPFWYNSSQKSRIEHLILSFNNSASAAYERFCKLHDNWMDIFVCARRLSYKFERSRACLIAPMM